MKPYPGDTSTMSRLRKNYNYRQSSARMPVEHVNGRLKRRWRILMTTAEVWYVDDMVDMILACCLLHNLCIVEGVDMDADLPSDDFWDVELDRELGNDMWRGPRRREDDDDERDNDDMANAQRALAEYFMNDV